MPRWFARDRSGHVGVFNAEHVVPPAAARLPDEALDFTAELLRLLLGEQQPSRGHHAAVHSGSLHMIAPLASVRRYAFEAVPRTDEIVAARFAARQRGREAGFMPGIRTFGAGEAEPTSALDRAHAAGICEGCIVAPLEDDVDETRLHGLGLYHYGCDEDLEILYCELAPAVPMEVAQLGDLAARCLRYAGDFATAAQLALGDLER